MNPVCFASLLKSPSIRITLASVSAFCAAVVMAGDGTMLWINTTANWGDSISWRKNVIAQDGGVATLQGLGILKQNVPGLTLQGLHFNASIGNFYGYPLTLTNGPFLNATVSGTRLNLPLKGEEVLHKYGVGQIELANSTFTGFSAVSIDEGTLLVSSNRTELVTGSSLLLNGGALVFAPTLTSGEDGLAYGATNATAFFAYGAGTSWVQPQKGNGESATLVLGGRRRRVFPHEPRRAGARARIGSERVGRRRETARERPRAADCQRHGGTLRRRDGSVGFIRPVLLPDV